MKVKISTTLGRLYEFANVQEEEYYEDGKIYSVDCTINNTKFRKDFPVVNIETIEVSEL